MTPAETQNERVDTAIQLAIERFGAKVLEQVREELNDFRKEFSGNYRTCATCDERHNALGDIPIRLQGVERTTNWQTGGLILIGASIPVALFIAEKLFSR